MSADAPAPARWIGLWHRWKGLVAALSFAAGLASLLLIERAEKVAQAMVILLPLSWLLLLAEPALQGLARRNPRLSLSPLVLRYAVQGLHQESLFFVLPFFLATTTWTSGQAAFTALLIAAALASMVDPLYYGWLAARRWAYLGLHALAVFATVLAAAPMLWLLDTAQSLKLACACMAVFSVPSLAHALEQRPGLGAALRLGALSLALAGAAWLGRAFIPPATLWVGDAAIAFDIDRARREPAQRLGEIPAAQAHAHGLVAWTAIRAPRGLHERIEHEWRRDGLVVDRIPLEITGGRGEGYRAWSRKRGFPDDPRGEWEVRVMTDAGQLVGVVRFRIA